MGKQNLPPGWDKNALPISQGIPIHLKNWHIFSEMLCHLQSAVKICGNPHYLCRRSLQTTECLFELYIKPCSAIQYSRVISGQHGSLHSQFPCFYWHVLGVKTDNFPAAVFHDKYFVSSASSITRRWGLCGLSKPMAAVPNPAWCSQLKVSWNIFVVCIFPQQKYGLPTI